MLSFATKINFFVSASHHRRGYLPFLFTLSLLLPACETTQPPTTTAAPVAIPSEPPHPTALTAEASDALALAEQSAVEALVKRALWSSAWDALQQARTAAKKFDSETTLYYAKLTTEFCNLGLKQTAYPAVIWNQP